MADGTRLDTVLRPQRLTGPRSVTALLIKIKQRRREIGLTFIGLPHKKKQTNPKQNDTGKRRRGRRRRRIESKSLSPASLSKEQQQQQQQKLFKLSNETPLHFDHFHNIVTPLPSLPTFTVYMIAKQAKNTMKEICTVGEMPTTL